MIPFVTLSVTQALLEGLSKRSAIPNHTEGVLTATELSCFVSSTVAKTAASVGHRQTPQFGRLLHYHSGKVCDGEFLFTTPAKKGAASDFGKKTGLDDIPGDLRRTTNS